MHLLVGMSYTYTSYIIFSYYRVCRCGLLLYDYPSYGGRSLLIKEQNANFVTDNYNDRVQSLVVQGECPWLMYEHINFNGVTTNNYVIFNSDSFFIHPQNYSHSTEWGGHGNQILSARALPPNSPDLEAIALFEHPNYGGRMVVLYSTIQNPTYIPSILVIS